MSKDNINPDHYKKECSFECIEVMSLMFGEYAVKQFCLCNAFKYMWRHRNKNGYEDLQKAKWYLDYVAKTLKSEDENYLLHRRLVSILETLTAKHFNDKET